MRAWKGDFAQRRGVGQPKTAHERMLGDLPVAHDGGEVDAVTAIHVDKRHTDTDGRSRHGGWLLISLDVGCAPARIAAMNGRRTVRPWAQMLYAQSQTALCSAL
jgi:hypothetical protein